MLIIIAHNSICNNFVKFHLKLLNSIDINLVVWHLYTHADEQELTHRQRFHIGMVCIDKAQAPVKEMGVRDSRNLANETSTLYIDKID
jgi:hypothetical protein